MHDKFFESLRRGVLTELEVLDAAGRLEYIRDIASLALLEPTITTAFINSLLETFNSGTP